MSELGYLTVTDIKHYGYCEAILYITHVLGIQESPTEYMEYGKEIEKEKYITPVIAKYKPVKILRQPQLVSKKYKINGSPDYVLITKHEYIPLEIKWAEPAVGEKAKTDHILQLTAYALLLEEKMKKTIKKGVIFYLKPEGKLVEINISYDLKLQLINALQKMQEIIENKREPKPAPKEKCESCNYRQYCPFKLN